MNQESIRLKDALLGALLHWRKIVIAGLVVAVLIGGFDIVNQLRSRKSSMEEYYENMAAYEEAVEEQELEIEFINKEIEEQEAKLANLRDYNERSVLLKIDPKQKAIASADYLIEMKDLKMIEGATGLLYDPTDAAVLDYAYNIISYVDWDEMARVSGEDPKYLYETIELYRNMDANLLTIYVVFYDQETAMKMLEVVEEAVEKVHENSKATVGEHTIKMINKGTRVNTDSALEKTQTDHITSEKSCEKELEDLKAELEGMKEIKRPERQFRYRRILIHAVIFGFIGLVVGACAALYWRLLRYTTEGKIHSGKELERLGKIKVLAAFEPTFNEKKRKNKIDHFLLSRAGIQQDQDPEKTIRMAALKLETLVEKDSTVLLTGNVSAEQLETLKQSIEKFTKAVQLECGTDLEKNPDTYDALRKADHTVLVEENNVGTYEQLAILRGIADEVKTPVIGCILI